MLPSVAALFWLWTRPKPMTDQDVVVLADFTNSIGESVFDGTLREALAFQLEQSPFLKVLDDAVMRQDLRACVDPLKNISATTWPLTSPCARPTRRCSADQSPGWVRAP
jgi:hypothetical protein